MNKIIKVIIAIIIAGAILAGVYFVLPETSQMYIKGMIQYHFDDDAKTHVDKIKAIKMPDTDITFGDGLEKACKSTAWYYEEGATDTWVVTFYGSKININLTGDGYDNVYTEKPIKITFSVRKDKNVDITINIGGEVITDKDKCKAIYGRIARAS